MTKSVPVNQSRVDPLARSHLARRIARCLTAIPAAMLAGAAMSTPAKDAAQLPLEAYAKAGMLVKVAPGRGINLRCVGHGAPTIVMTAGAGEQSLTWRELQGVLAAKSRVCAWDRAGMGFSDPSNEVQDVGHRTGDLARALIRAGVAPPYLLVGHSLGSFETLMFAFRNPAKVAGIVLVDPSGPNQNERIARAAPALWAIIDPLQQAQVARLAQCVASAGRRPVITNPSCLAPPSPGYPSALNTALARSGAETAGQRNQLSILQEMASGRDSARLMAAWHPLGNMPLVVLTAGVPPQLPVTGAAADDMPRMQAEWSRIHDDIAALSTRGVNRTVAGASHYIHVDQPAAVIEAVEDVRSAARAGRAKISK